MYKEIDPRPSRRLRHLIAGLSLTAATATLSWAWADDGGHHGTDASERLGRGVALIEARKLYLANCAGCHGERGQGTAEASVDFSDAQALVRLTRDKFGELLAGGHGAEGGASLADAERDAITAYVRTYLMLPAPDADTEIGRTIYSQTCSVCHGDRGDAASWAENSLNPPPADFTAHSLRQLSRQEMIDTVTFGEDGTAMVAFATQLSHEEIAATVDFIRTAFMREEAAPKSGDAGHGGHDHGGHDQSDASSGDQDRSNDGHAGHDHGAASSGGTDFPNGLVGDVAWGEEFYGANCAECHGDKGDGVGPRAYFMIVKPANFLSRDMRAELDRPTLFEHIAKGVNGTTMPAWSTVLSDQQIANVGEYVYQTFLRPSEKSEHSHGPKWRAADPAEDGQKKN